MITAFSRRLPAADGVHVGGDWYDAFPAGRGLAGLAIGDVGGHSIGSASVMGQIRSILRTCAIDDPSPPAVLRRTNEAVGQLVPDALASVFYAGLDLRTGELGYACASHPPPLVVCAGRTEFLDDAPDVMLGASTAIPYPAGRRRLAPGARLLLYTDGLVEDRHSDITPAPRPTMSASSPSAGCCPAVRRRGR